MKRESFVKSLFTITAALTTIVTKSQPKRDYWADDYYFNIETGKFSKLVNGEHVTVDPEQTQTQEELKEMYADIADKLKVEASSQIEFKYQGYDIERIYALPDKEFINVLTKGAEYKFRYLKP